MILLGLPRTHTSLIPDQNFSIPDPGSRVKKGTGFPDPQYCRLVCWLIIYDLAGAPQDPHRRAALLLHGLPRRRRQLCQLRHSQASHQGCAQQQPRPRCLPQVTWPAESLDGSHFVGICLGRSALCWHRIQIATAAAGGDTSVITWPESHWRNSLILIVFFSVASNLWLTFSLVIITDEYLFLCRIYHGTV